jgi:hypothetical protein
MSATVTAANQITKLNLLRCLNAISLQYFFPGDTLVISIPNVEDIPSVNKETWKRSFDDQKVPNFTYIKMEKLRLAKNNSYVSANIMITGSYKDNNSWNFNSRKQNEWNVTKNDVTYGLNFKSHNRRTFRNDKHYYYHTEQRKWYFYNDTNFHNVCNAYKNKGTFKYFKIFSNENKEDIWDFGYQAIQLLHEPLNWPLVISSADDSGHEARTYKDANYIIITCNMDDTEKVIQRTGRQLQALSARASWNPRGKFLILITENYGEHGRATVKQLLQLLWSFKVINAVVAISHQKSALVLYTWFPYQSPGLCTNVRETAVNYWVFEDGGRFLLSSNLFPQKIPHDLKGCSITVSTTEIEPFVILSYSNTSSLAFAHGLEGRFFRSIMKKLNLSFKLKLPGSEGWGEKLPNNTWTGLKGDLFNNVTELGFGGLLLDTELCEVFDCTVTYLKDTLVWHVPRAKQVPHWKGLYGVFNKKTWVVILVLSIAVALLLWRMGCLSKETSYVTVVKCLSQVWAIMLGVSVPEMPRASNLRLLFLIWVIYCLHINAIYLSFLTSFLINPGFEHQVRTVEELVQSKLDYGYHSGFDKYFNDSTDKILVKILSRRKHCDRDGDDCLKRMAERGDFAMLVSKMLVQYKNAFKYVDQSGNTLFNHFHDAFLGYDFVMYLAKGSHLLERVDSIIQRMVQAGLLKKWWEKMKTTLRLKQAFRTEQESTTLAFSHLQSVFVFLFFGLVISVIVFICEFLSSRGFLRIK